MHYVITTFKQLVKEKVMAKPEYDQVFTIRINSDQLDRIKCAADRRGINMSAFCRQSMLYFADKILGEPCEPDPKDD
jgi:predicted DNA binding CopG/RHH family protein